MDLLKAEREIDLLRVSYGTDFQPHETPLLHCLCRISRSGFSAGRSPDNLLGCVVTAMFGFCKDFANPQHLVSTESVSPHSARSER